MMECRRHLLNISNIEAYTIELSVYFQRHYITFYCVIKNLGMLHDVQNFPSVADDDTPDTYYVRPACLFGVVIFTKDQLRPRGW